MRYRFRYEYFGGLIYDTTLKKYIYVDNLVSHLIQNFSSIINDETAKKNICLEYETDKKELEEIIEYLFTKNLTDNNIEKNEIVNSSTYLSAPLRIFYDITYKCNLKCKHCFTNSGDKRDNELNFVTKKKIIDQMAEMGTYRLSIAGGEPLVESNLFDFIKYARSRSIDVSFTTNGSMINNSTVEILNDLDIKTLTISLDGGTKKSHDYIRGTGQFDQITKTLELLSSKYNGTVSLKTTLMKNNIGELKELVEFAEKMGCNVIKFNCIRPDGRALINKELLLTQDDYIETIKKASSLNNEKVKLKLPLNIFQKQDYNYIKDLGFGCFAGKESICINPIGDVKPCSHMPEEFIAGNVKCTTLQQIWNESKVLNNFRTLEGNDICNSCEKYDYCRGGCRYRAYLYGNINGVDPYCYLKKNIEGDIRHA